MASFNSKVKQQVDVRQEEALEEGIWTETLKELDKAGKASVLQGDLEFTRVERPGDR